MEKEILIIPEPTVKNAVESIVIPARSNCVLQVRAGEVINLKLVSIKKHVLNKDVIIANSLSPVKNNMIISNIINISEQPFIVDELSTSHLK
jgi:6-phosphogluconate dehydrogenase